MYYDYDCYDYNDYYDYYEYDKDYDYDYDYYYYDILLLLLLINQCWLHKNKHNELKSVMIIRLIYFLICLL